MPMNKYLRGCLKIVIIVSYPVLIVSVIVFAILFITNRNELNQIKDQFRIAQENLNTNSQESQITIDNLQESFNNFNKEISTLKDENDQLKASADELKAQGYAEIRGSTVPFIIGDSSFSQYQLVCAENILNKNLQYCRTVPAIEKDFSLLVPAGSYHVFARVVGSDSKFSEAKAYYTEYIKCVREKKSENCDVSLSSKNIQLTLIAGQVLIDIDPIDWSGVKKAQ